MLTLIDELFILSLDEETTRPVVSRRQMRRELAGALLAELSLRGKVCIGEGGQLETLDADPTGDGMLDKAMTVIQGSKRFRKVSYWVKVFSAAQKKPARKLKNRLVDEGILKLEGDHLLWVIPAPNFPPGSASPKYWIKNRLRSAILACEPVDLHTLALLGLALSDRLQRLVFTQDERKSASQRTHQRILTEAMANRDAQFIEEIIQVVNAS
ncbi:MAG: GPP34 family phosphoprotein [Chloroflexota bacterium]|nr:MAG: GPP34 family phosphoprotein [Chloroflexota bacterium]